MSEFDRYLTIVKRNCLFHLDTFVSPVTRMRRWRYILLSLSWRPMRLRTCFPHYPFNAERKEGNWEDQFSSTLLCCD